MSAPKRIQMSRQHPWRADNPDAVIVARPSKWSNPYRASPIIIEARDTGHPISESEARAQVVKFFRRDVTSFDPQPWVLRMLGSLSEIAGKDLACWCPLDQPCHADVLLWIANGNPS